MMEIDLPAKNGSIDDLENLALDCHESGEKLTVHADRLALAILRDPSEFGADRVVIENHHNLPEEMSDREMKALAERVHSRATYLSEMVQAYGYEQANVQFFDTIRVRMDGVSLEPISLPGIEMRVDDEFILIRVLPNVSLDDMNATIEMLADGVGAMAQEEDDDEAFDGMWTLDEELCK